MSWKLFRRRLGAIPCAVCLLVPASARDWYVNHAAQAPFDGSSFAHGFQAIQDAVTAAVDDDDIRVAQGTYPSFHVREKLFFYGGYAGTDDTTRSTVSFPTVVDGGGAGSAIACDAGSSAVFDGFTIQNGAGGPLGGGKSGGGGILAAGSYCGASNCLFRNNSVDAAQGCGGAVVASGGSQLNLDGCTFTNNAADRGGAVAVLAGSFASFIRNCTFDHNGQASATSPRGQLGGALYLESVDWQGVTSQNTFTSNKASFGGAVFLEKTNNQILSANTFTDNVAGDIGSGGALFNEQSDPVIVSGNLFRNNRAQSYGGAIYSDTPGAASVSFSSNVVVGNYAGAVTFTGISGGGMVAGGAAILNNTIVAQQHGAGLSISSPAYTANNIVAYNPAGITRDSGVVAGPLHANDVVGNENGFGPADYININDPTGADGNIQQDPLFVDRAGGDFHLQGASPCLNAGNTADAAAFATTKDFDDQARVSGPRVDIGADEFYPTLVFTAQPGLSRPGRPLAPQPVVALRDRAGNSLGQFNGPVTLKLNGTGLGGTATVDTVGGVASFTDLTVSRTGHGFTLTATAGFDAESATSAPFDVLFQRGFVKTTGANGLDGGSWETAKATIPAALLVTGGPGAEVWVATGAYDGPVTIPDDVNVYGGFEGTEARLSERAPGRRSTLNGNGAGPCVRFVSSSGNGIDGFRLTGGNGQLARDLGVAEHREGGAVYIDAASPRVSNNLIFQNTATWGGAISATGGRPVIVGNIITRNTAVSVSGLAGAGGGVFMNNGVLANNLIYENLAGGAAANPASFGAALLVGAAEVRNNTFVGNRGPAGQGDITIVASAKFTNNIIKNVSAIAKEGRSSPTFSHNDYVPGAAVANQIASPVGTNGNIGTTPVFVAQGSDDYHLPPDSFLKDIGEPSVVDRGERDMDGEPRLMGAGVDIGADEAAVPYTLDDAGTALRIAGGIQTASLADALRLDLSGDPGVDAQDAIGLLRKAAGLEPNP